MMNSLVLFLCILLAHQVYCLRSNRAESTSRETSDREEKLLSLFQIITFPNDMCSNANRNGTCYTAEECSTRGGFSNGTCANGFGVCCISILSCGGSSSENNTFLVQASATSITSPCVYTICPTDNDICRIRLDFTTFHIAGPQAGTNVAVGNAPVTTANGAIGHCLTDTFTVSSPGSKSSPLICGFNTGQHMVFDVNPPDCLRASFALGGTATTRQWDIAVRQYNCANSVDLAGTPGCLQYFTGSTGTFSSFNFPATLSNTATTHLANQDYTLCFRQEQGFCGICYSAAMVTPIISVSFGLSVSATAAMATSGVGSFCATDYIHIPSARATLAGSQITESRFCGRFLASDTMTDPADAPIVVSVCSGVSPFVVSFFSDATEANTATATMLQNNEQEGMPGGILGFRLQYLQQSC